MGKYMSFAECENCLWVGSIEVGLGYSVGYKDCPYCGCSSVLRATEIQSRCHTCGVTKPCTPIGPVGGESIRVCRTCRGYRAAGE